MSLLEQPTVAKSADLTWRLLPSKGVEEALALWRQLHLRLRNQAVACDPIWIETWLRHYGDSQPHRFAVATAGGLTRGIALLADGVGQKLGPFPVRTLHLGTAGEQQPGSVCVEYNQPLVEETFAEEFQRGLGQIVLQEGRWEQFRLDGFTEHDLQPWLDLLPDAEVRTRDSRFFDLRQTREQQSDILSQLGKSTRYNIRRRLRQYGELDCEWATDLETAEEILNELISLHQARWQGAGQAGAFANPRFDLFQRDVSMRLFHERKAVLFRVRHQGETVGCLFLLVDRNRLLDYLSGFADFDVKPSPGLISHYLCLEQALTRGYDAYDFLVGDKRHKSNLSNSVTTLCWLSSSRPSWKLSAIRLLKKIKHSLRPASPPVDSTSSTDQE
ncbi:GNAT family N-acetyltransferase [Planctomicrobium sp. SH664]|uniref:GNAT family N-acetyltransferase n=1 Tax=Planctomicrobium sp. SH664 TaxID=3448125 RepID=UPI003F5C72C7